MTDWQQIGTVRSQEEVLVCNDCYLGWWCVAIQNALGEWEEAGSTYRSSLKYPPTHWQALPSIAPIGLRTGKPT